MVNEQPGISSEIPGTVYNMTDLTNYNFLMGFYTVTSITSLTQDIMRPAEFLAKDLSLEKNPDAPQILIFHTHSQEGFTDTVEGDTSTTIVGVGDYLAELLTNTFFHILLHCSMIFFAVSVCPSKPYSLEKMTAPTCMLSPARWFRCF